jgi:hypothetical protein
LAAWAEPSIRSHVGSGGVCVSAVRVAPGVIRIEVGDRLYAASLACTLATTVALRDISLDHGREVRVRTEADYEAILPNDLP